MPCLSRRAPVAGRGLQIHTIVEAPLTPDDVGRVTCRASGEEPVSVEWSGPPGMEVDATGREVAAAPVGTYEVVAQDATGERAECVVEVPSLLAADAVVVHEYRTTPASSGTARDGAIEAVGVGLDEGVRMLWTTGVETAGPLLSDVSAGAYAATPVDGRCCVHLCAPGRVGVEPL